MSDIAKIDKNFKVISEKGNFDLCFYDAEQKPFKIYGIKKENGRFRRMPEEIARSVSEGVYMLHTNTAGGRVRFVTDSTCVAVRAEFADMHFLSHMPRTGVVGLDMYVREREKEKYCGTFVPPYDMQDGFESILHLEEKKERLVTINFPLYSSLSKLYIGVEKGADVKEAPDYKYETPVVYYGSSITQGGCASRPGMCYEHILTRKFDCNHINLGFSGSAKGEAAMRDWIKQLEMKVFVLDYDYNAENCEQLQATHERMFREVREVQPEVPIIIMSRPKHDLNDGEKKRLEIIRSTYKRAVDSGDKNVYLLDNEALTADIGDEGTVDNVHPTDSGFVSMARAIAPVLDKILGKIQE